MPNLRRIGRLAEDQAAEYLIREGFTIITRGYCVKGGEIDIVAMEEDLLVFVEVRFRRSEADAPEATLNQRKVARFRSAAAAYLDGIGEPDRAHRFDVVAVTGTQLRHHRDALHFD